MFCFVWLTFIFFIKFGPKIEMDFFKTKIEKNGNFLSIFTSKWEFWNEEFVKKVKIEKVESVKNTKSEIWQKTLMLSVY